MKKNKKIFITLFLVFCLFNFVDVSAHYNGEGGGFTNLDGTKECGTTPNCQYNNFNVFYLKMTLYYIDNGNFDDPIGESYYLSRTGDRNWLKTLGVKEENIYDLGDLQDDLDKVSEESEKRYEEAYKLLKIHFGDREEKVDNVMNKNLRDFLNKVTGGDYEKELIKDTEFADPSGKKPATKGYRLVIEPSISYINVYDEKLGRKVGKTFTVKGAADKRVKNPGFTFSSFSLPLIKGEGNSKVQPQSQFLFTKFKDVGISGESRENCTNGLTIKELADVKNGCGYNIIDVGKFIKKYCYVENGKNENLKCTNKDSNNIGTFTEKYSKEQCTTEEYKSNTNKKYGKRIKKLDNCSVYCVESATASFPGHISEALELEKVSVRGNYFTWPSRFGTSGMKMFMKSKLTCRIKNEEGKKCSADDINKLKNEVESYVEDLANEKNMTASLKAGTNKEIDGALISRTMGGEDREYKNDDPNKKEDPIIYTNGWHYENWNNIKVNKTEEDETWSNEFSAERKVYFEIPSNKNRLYNKESGNVKDGTGADITNIFDRKEGVVSLLADQDVDKIYDLEIKQVSLGSGNQFGKLIDKYVCHYKVTDTPCVCPEGTVMEGTPLYDKLTKDKTCAELQITECNKCDCPPNTDNEYNIELEGEEATTEACKNLQQQKCYNYCVYGKTKVFLTPCITEQISQNNLSKEEAYNVCKERLCPVCTDSYGVDHDLSDCLATGKPYALCEQKVCPKGICVGNDCYTCTGTCTWKLDKKTKTTLAYNKECSSSPGKSCGYVKMSCPSGNEEMLEASSCIQTQLKDDLKGNSIEVGLTKGLITDADVRSAFAVCEKKVCPYSGSKIIYRQIDLNDPFPGKEHKGTGEEKYSNNNQNTKSRKPGENWNSDIVIKNQILEGRGVKGYELYNKDPLYIIVLTPDTMRKIRDYNSKTKYDDFNLTCTNKNKTSHCISEFLHKGIDNLNPSNFIKSSYGNKKSVSACYNMDYSEGSFNNCYNQNN